MESDVTSSETVFLNNVNGTTNGEHNSKSSSSAGTSLDYQALADKLHELATTDRSMTITSSKSPTTPPQTLDNKEGVEEISRGELDDVVVSRDEFGVTYVRYQSERQMADLMKLISSDLSEPYSIYTYRYFIHNWPDLCFLVSM